MGARKRILYLQHANPAAYPPLEYSSRILAEAGWEILFIAVHSDGPQALRFPHHPLVRTTVLPYMKPGWRQKMGYARFSWCAVYAAYRWKPDWVYVSDALAAPAGVLLSKLLGCRIIYHEHDALPQRKSGAGLKALVLRARRVVSRLAACNILPQLDRIEVFKAETGSTRPVERVWNCPPRAAALEAVMRMRKRDEPLAIYFHGSINLERVPLSLIEGAKLCAFDVRIRIVGYETIGSKGVCDQLRAAAATAANVSLELPGAASRRELRQLMHGMHVGWISFVNRPEDLNLQHLVGASNKAFDYLAACLPLIVPDRQDWRAFYVDPGYAVACDAADPVSVASALRWFHDHASLAAEMGLKGRQRVLDEWHYERQFKNVFELLNNGATGSTP
jgi:glycosyltransferase involved in cell wall biosynthesis